MLPLACLRRARARPDAARRRVARALAACALVPAVAGRAASPVAELRLSVAVGPALPLGRAAERWAEHLRVPGPDAVSARLHPGASLAERDPARELAALREGRADLAVGSALAWATQVPALAVFALPWAVPDDVQLAALAREAALRALLAAKLAAAGVRLVALAPLGYRELANALRPIRAPEDLAGLRLRTSPWPLVQETLRALGARPATVAYAEAQALFAKGELDGQEGMPSALAAARVPAQGQRHVTDLGAFGDAMVFGVRETVWAAWSGAQQQRCTAAAERAVAEAAALEREQAALRQLGAQGAAVLRLTAAGQQAFRAAVHDVAERWRGAVGAEVVAAAARALDAAAAPAGAPAGPSGAHAPAR